METRLALLTFILALLIPLSVAGAEIPPTIPHPPINGDNGYVIGVTNLDTRTLLWRAPYLYDLPYVSDSGWLAGDRVGYGCAYGFLHRDGEIIGRFTFRAIPDAASYMRVNDTYMDEGVRYYDGSLTPPGTTQVPNFECPAVSESYASSSADERPVVAFWDGDEVVEIRDYRETSAANGVTFDLVAEIRNPFTVTSSVSGTHTVNSRVSVVAMDHGIPVAVVYYDALGSGSMFAPTATETPNPDDCNVIVSMSQGRQVYNGVQFGNPAVSPLEALTGEQWMLQFKSGKTLLWFAVASNWDTLDERHRCGTDAEIDRVVLIFDPREPNQTNNMIAYLNTVAGIVADRYPNAEFNPALLVGAESHIVCTGNGQVASRSHANRIDELETSAFTVGPDLDIPCSGYSDSLGHLNDSGAASANSQVGAFYSGG